MFGEPQLPTTTRQNTNKGTFKRTLAGEEGRTEKGVVNSQKLGGAGAYISLGSFFEWEQQRCMMGLNAARPLCSGKNFMRSLIRPTVAATDKAISWLLPDPLGFGSLSAEQELVKGRQRPPTVDELTYRNYQC